MASSLLLLTLVASAGIKIVQGQMISAGKCSSDVHVVPGFFISSFAGTWYTISQIPEFFAVGNRCSRSEYKVTTPVTLSINNTATRGNHSFVQILGTGTVLDLARPAELTVRLDRVPWPAPYGVLATDYINYAVVYSCVDIKVGKTEFAFVLSRRRTLDKHFIPLVENVFNRNGLQAQFAKLKAEQQQYCVNY